MWYICGMRILYIIASAVLFLGLMSCENPAKEIGKGAIETIDRSRATGAAAGLDTMNNAVETFRASNDRLPASLEELIQTMGITVDASLYNYDTATGRVTLK